MDWLPIEKIQARWENGLRLVSNDIGIDLGTANTRMYVRGQGIVLSEPSIVAVNQKTDQVVAVGSQAKRMVGRTPSHITAVKSMVGGVISDFEITEEMLAYFLAQAQKNARKLLGPRVVVGVPSGITNVEIRAVRDATRNAGAREVHIVEEPMASAIGIRLPVMEPAGNMIIDIGDGTTDIAVISLGGVVKSKNLRIAGGKLNDDIMSYIRSEFKILIGEKSAEDIKTSIGAVIPWDEPRETAVRGRDLVTGLPREVIITDADVREAIGQSVQSIVEATKEVLETSPPEIISDVMRRGIHLVGGGALIRGIPEVISEYTKIDVHLADDPVTSVARGTGIILENIGDFEEILIVNEDDLHPQ